MRCVIQNCGSSAAGDCVESWDELELTGDRMIRFCSACMRTVVRCESDEEAEARIAAGQLVATVAATA